MAAPIRPLPDIPWPALGVPYREFSIDQATILNALQLRRNPHAAVVGGICAAFVIEWATRVQFGRIPTGITYLRQLGEGMKAIVAAQFGGYVGHAVGLQQMTATAQAFGVNAFLVTSGSGSARYGIKGAPAVIVGATIRCGRQVGCLLIRGGGNAHAIGFHIRQGGTCRFFDPNYGQFSFPDARQYNVTLQSLLEFEYSEMSTFEIYDFTAMPHA